MRRRITRRRFLGLSGAGLAGAALAGTMGPVAGAKPAAGTRVSWDRYSLKIGGRRVYVWSGEFHPFRLPSPDLWRDVLEKMKAEGYNAVSAYFDWGYHSPKRGVYDFSGVRDMERFLRLAGEVGLYVIARPGPYINGELDAGGFPGWLLTQDGMARSDAADYLEAVDEWFGKINRIIARHQITDGGGSVILYQIENELAATGPSQRTYMQHLHDRARSDGITVPIFHNDKGRNGIWVPPDSGVEGTVPGPVDLYAFDGYPGGTCHSDGTPGGPNAAPDWGIWGPGGATGGASASPKTPGFVAEFGGGWFDYWGSVGTYGCMAEREGPGYERVFYKTNVANRLTVHNVYMTFGGTSWGWLPAPVVYTSYDYGAAFDEARQIRPKATAMKEIGLFLQCAAPEITQVDEGDAVTTSSPAVKVYHNVNRESGVHFYVAMHDPSSLTSDDEFTFTIRTGDGSYTVPRSGTLRISGQDAKIFAASYPLERQHLVYSTSEIMTHLGLGQGDAALLYGRDGEDGETVLRYRSRPRVRVLRGEVDAAWDGNSGDLRLDYVHEGLTEVRISGGGRPPLTLLLADLTTAGTFWRHETSAGPVLVRGPHLVRGASVRGSLLDLRGDTAGGEELEVWTPARVREIGWNGRRVGTSPGDAGSLHARERLPGPEPFELPDLSRLVWRSHRESPEAEPGFDDSGWRRAQETSTGSTTPPPPGQPVLTADDYGFHHGDVWYRGRFSGAAAGVTLRYGGGGAGMLQAWMDGRYLGQHVLQAGLSSPPTTGTATFEVPREIQADGPHVLSVMVRNNGHNEDGGVNDAHKEGRGLISALLSDAAGDDLETAISWRIQGNLGGEDIPDPVRGPFNNGGLYGEREGWHLPGFPDSDWEETSVPAPVAEPGTSWYRTTFRLSVPEEDDASLGITIGDPSTPRSDANYRALIFVNGWNMGQYIANVGPQHTFVVPDGILDPRGPNTLAIAVTSDGGPGNGLERVSLTNLGTVRGGVPVRPVRAPTYQEWRRRALR